jgi:hypothetical protein
MFFPVAEIRNEVLADFSGRIDAHVGIEALPVADRFKVNQAYGKEHAALFSLSSRLRALEFPF